MWNREKHPRVYRLFILLIAFLIMGEPVFAAVANSGVPPAVQNSEKNEKLQNSKSPSQHEERKNQKNASVPKNESDKQSLSASDEKLEKNTKPAAEEAEKATEPVREAEKLPQAAVPNGKVQDAKLSEELKQPSQPIQESVRLQVEIEGELPSGVRDLQMVLRTPFEDKTVPIEEHKGLFQKPTQRGVVENLAPGVYTVFLQYYAGDTLCKTEKNIEIKGDAPEVQESIPTGYYKQEKNEFFVNASAGTVKKIDAQGEEHTYRWNSAVDHQELVLTFEEVKEGKIFTRSKENTDSQGFEVRIQKLGSSLNEGDSKPEVLLSEKSFLQNEKVEYRIPLSDQKALDYQIQIFNKGEGERISPLIQDRRMPDPLAGPEVINLQVIPLNVADRNVPAESPTSTPTPFGATTGAWRLKESKSISASNADIKFNSVTQEGNQLVWNVTFTPNASTNNNNLYHRLDFTANGTNPIAIKDVTAVSGMDKSLDGTYYRSSSAPGNRGAGTYEIRSNITDNTLKEITLSVKFSIIQKVGSEPAIAQRASAENTFTIVKAQDQGTLQIQVKKEAGAENVDLSGTTIALTKDGKEESIPFAQADHKKDVGSYSLAVKNVPAGYIIEPMNANANITKDQATTVIFTVKPEVQKGNITLTVVNDTGQDVSGAKFVLEKDGVEKGVPLNDQTLSDQLAGNYTFKVVGLPAGYSAEISPASLKLESGQTAKVTVTIKAAGTLQLTLKKEGNVPDQILNDVNIFAEKDGNKTQLNKTGANSLSVGKYNILVENLPSDYVATIQTSPVEIRAGQSEDVIVTIKEKTPPLAKFLLRVTFPKGQNYPQGMTATLSNAAGNYQGTWNGNEFLFENIKPGTYTLSFNGMPLDWKMKAPNPPEVTVSEQSPTATAELEKEEIAKDEILITGRMQDNGNQPIEKTATFVLIGPDGQEVVQAGERVELQADDSGQIRKKIKKLPAGDYKVKAVTPPQGYKTSQPDNVTNTLKINDTDTTYDFTARFIPSGFQFIVHVTNSSGDPLQGAEFKILNAQTGAPLQSNGVDLVLISDGTGTAKAVLENAPAGDWKLVNTKAPKGYKTYPEIPFSLKNNDTKAELNVSLMRSDASRVQWDVYLKDKAGNPIPNKVLKFYQADGVTPVTRLGQPLVITTSDSGEYKGGAFVDIQPGTYVVKFEGDANYTPAEAKVTIPDNMGKVTTDLITDIKGEQGTITVKVVTKDGSPVPNAGYQILDNTGKMVAQGLTDKNGIGTSPLLPLGNYQVKLVETGNIYRVEVNGKKDDNPQNVILTTDKKQQEVTFHVETKLINVTTAGSLKIDGAWVEGDTENPTGAGMVSWTVSATKNASTVDHWIKQVKLSVPANEMGQPSLPKVTKMVKNGDKTTMVEVPAKGVWKKVGDNWVYEEDRSDDKSTVETTYVYNFQAPAIEGAPEYSLTGTMQMGSTNPLEIIPPATGKEVLDEKVDVAKKSFDGEGTTDNITDTIKWTIQDYTLLYDGSVEAGTLPPPGNYNENKIPGKFIYTITLPENSGQKPLDGNEVLTVEFFEEYNKEGDPNNQNKVPLDLKYTKKFDPAKKAWIIEVERPTTGKFRPKFNLTTKIDREQTVDQYRIQLDTKFESGSVKQTFKPDVFTAFTIPQLPGERVEVISNCSDVNRHGINLYGEMTEDKKSIRWTARVTNLSTAEYYLVKQQIAPIVLNLEVGEGLGDAKIINVASIGKTFPYIWKPDDQKVTFDSQNAGKKFDLRADYTHHYIPRGVFIYNPPNPGDTYSYITGISRGISGLVPYDMTEKTDLVGQKYVWDRGSNLLERNSGPNYQRLAAGEYMIVTFETPITDFSRAENGGYTVTTHSKRYHYDDKDQTDSATPLCTADASLTLKTRPNTSESSEVFLKKDGVGEVRGNGKYINDGKDIEWSINIKPLLENVADWTAKRNLKVVYALVNDADERGESKTGLGPMANVKEDAVRSGGMTISQTVDTTQDGGTISLTGMKINESYKLTFTTPVNADKKDYRLRIIGIYDGNQPLQNGNAEDGNVGYVIVPGKTIEINVLKRWEKVYDNQQKPDITLNLTRVGIDGSREVVLNKTVSTANTEKSLMIKMDVDNKGEKLKRFDKNGFLYDYYVTENSVPGYKSQVDRMSINGDYWMIRNTADDTVANEKDPFKYVTKGDGTYPEPFVQDGPDIRNADATGKSPITGNKFNTWDKPNEKGVDYKAEYADSIVGKWGEQSEVPGQFNMNLTIEGKGKYGTGDIDVVFVLDNSNSMRFTWQAQAVNNQYKNSKMKSLSETVHSLVDLLEKREGNTRVGIVNFATVVEPLGDPPRDQRQYYQYPSNYEMALSDTKTQRTQINSAIPGEYAARYNKHIDWSENDGQHNVGTKYDGMTNIADGIRRGAELLYPDSEKGTPTEKNRKKIMILVSDGAPVAHLKLKYFPLRTDLSLVENLSKSGAYHDRGQYGPYVINNNKFKLYGATKYTTENGVPINDHMMPTIALSNYYKELHSDMEVFSVAIASDTNGFASSGRLGDDFDLATAIQWQEQVLRGIASDPDKNYYKAESDEELKAYLLEFQKSLPQASIVDGIVEDPMGDMVMLDAKHGWKVASSPELKDGDFYLSDNHGFYLGQDGQIYNNRPGEAITVGPINQYKRDAYSKPSLVYAGGTYTLDTNGQPMQIYENGWINNAYEEQGEGKAYGMYRYLLAINNRDKAPENYLTYPEGATGFTVITSIDMAIKAKEQGKKLILIKNSDPKNLFISQLGRNQMPKVQASRQEKNLLQGVKVERIGEKIKITGLNLTTKEEVRLRYRIHLKTEDPSFAGDYYYPGNKTTTLDPRPKTDPDKFRYFPIPSVKGPTVPMAADKFWLDAGGNLLDPKKVSEDLLKLGRDSIDVRIKRYKAKVNADGVIVDENSQPINNGIPVKDGFPEVMGTKTLNFSNNWHEELKDLPAYDNNGKPFIYEFEEANSVPGYAVKTYSYIPKFSYTIDKGISGEPAEGYKLLADGQIRLDQPLVGTPLKWKIKYKNSEKEEDYTPNNVNLSDDKKKISISMPQDTNIEYIKLTTNDPTNDPTIYFRPEAQPHQTFSIENIGDNTPQGEFEILKIEGNNKSKPLSGAQFELVKIVDKKEDPSSVIQHITDKDGKIRFTQLEKGTYKLKEVKAPSGYQLKFEPIDVTVGEPIKKVTVEGKEYQRYTVTFSRNGKTINPDGYLGPDGNIVLDENKQPVLTGDKILIPSYTISNEVMALPNTGGMGFTFAALWTGVALLMACSYIYKVNMGGDEA